MRIGVDGDFSLEILCLPQILLVHLCFSLVLPIAGDGSLPLTMSLTVWPPEETADRMSGRVVIACSLNSIQNIWIST